MFGEMPAQLAIKDKVIWNWRFEGYAAKTEKKPERNCFVFGKFIGFDSVVR